MNLNTMKKIYEPLPWSILLANRDHEIQYANNAFIKMTNYNLDDLIGTRVETIIGNEISLNRHENQLFTDVRLNNKLIVDIKTNLIEDTEVTIFMFIDTSYQKELKEKLHIESERMIEAKRLAKFGHWELNLESNNLYWSDEVFKMFGVDKGSFTPSYERFLEIIHPEDVDFVNNTYLISLRNKSEYEIDHRVVINDEILYYKEKGKSFYKDGVAFKSIGMVQDITDRVRKDIEVKLKEEELLKTKSAIINVLSGMTDMRDNDTGKHIQRTQTYVKLIAEALKANGDDCFNDDYIALLVQVSSLHDIGKVGIRDNILLKPDKLTEHEFDIMKNHTTIGYNVIEEAKTSSGISESEYLDMAQNIILHHHERWNGTGYPNGLKGIEISIEGRIMSLVDVYDALRSERVYKKEFTHKKSLSIVKSESGKQFDPELVRVFLKIEKEFEKISNELRD